MTALEKFKQCGLRFRLSPNGELQISARGALALELRDEVARCKAELIDNLKREAASDFIHWQKLSPDQRAGILPTIKAGQSVRIYSELLSEIVWWVHDEQTAKALRKDPRYQGEGIYTLEELKQIQGKSPDFLRDIHRFKKEFGATLAKTEPQPVLRAGLAIITAGEVRP